MGKRSAGFNISVHPRYAMHVTFFEAGGDRPPRRGARADILASPTSIIASAMSTPRRLGVVMDPIGAITYAKDSTLAMLLAAQARGFELVYLEQRDLLLRDGVAEGQHAAAHRAGRPGRLVHARAPRSPRRCECSTAS